MFIAEKNVSRDGIKARGGLLRPSISILDTLLTILTPHIIIVVKKL